MFENASINSIKEENETLKKRLDSLNQLNLLLKKENNLSEERLKQSENKIENYKIQIVELQTKFKDKELIKNDKKDEEFSKSKEEIIRLNESLNSMKGKLPA